MAWDRDPPRDEPGARHGAASHQPVMLAEVIRHLEPKQGEVVVDGTFGRGGYSRAILAAGASVVAIDRDPKAIAAAESLARDAGGRLVPVEGRFGALDSLATEAGFDWVDAVVLDVGVSSPQLDDPGRGFSFRQDGPLDMRMGREGPSASDIVNRASEADLADIVFRLGEERRSRAVARAIVAERARGPIETTGALARIVERVVPKAADGIHPATRTFQALRLFVNQELTELAKALAAAERILREGGRLVVVAFHSLEDRIVKRFLADRSRERSGGSRHMPEAAVPEPTFRVLTKRPDTPSEAEITANPRARSARLRAAVRLAGAPRTLGAVEIGVPALPAFGGLA